MRAAVERAVAIDGVRALECPQTSAAFNEAGHCVIGASQGERPSKVSIWPIRELGRCHWIGRTGGTPRWRVGGETLPEADLKHAQSQLAGVVAEALFDADYRLASSIDEIVASQAIVRSAATKLQRDAEQLWLETFAWVATRLRANEPVVRDIADELMRKGSIKSRQLANLLQTVEGAR
jgi:hypothetical protein